MRSKTLTSLAGLVLLLSGCSDLSYRNLARKNTQWQFDWQSGSCYRTCPVYSASVDQNGALRFSGIAQTAFKGDTTVELGRTFSDSLLLQLKRMDYLAMDTAYGLQQGVFDVQIDNYNLQSGGSAHQIRTQMEVPEPLKNLKSKLDQSLRDQGLL